MTIIFDVFNSRGMNISSDDQDISTTDISGNDYTTPFILMHTYDSM